MTSPIRPEQVFNWWCQHWRPGNETACRRQLLSWKTSRDHAAALWSVFRDGLDRADHEAALEIVRVLPQAMGECQVFEKILSLGWEDVSRIFAARLQPESREKVGRRLLRQRSYAALDLLMPWLPLTAQRRWLKRYPGYLPRSLARQREAILEIALTVSNSSTIGRKRPRA